MHFLRWYIPTAQSYCFASIVQVIDPSKITMFVLDEADVMIDQQGQQDQTIRIQK